MKLLKLGVVQNNRGALINHRSLLKVVMNPFLRVLGVQVATLLDPNTLELSGLVVTRCPFLLNLPKNLWSSWVYRLNAGDRVIPYRRCI